MRMPRIKNQGYTLVEMVVAMTLFVIAFTLASAAFINALRSQRQIVAFITANDNAIATMEQMTREIRTGINFISAGSSLQFTNAKGEVVMYRLNGGRIERGVGDNFSVITAENVRINYLEFVMLALPSIRITIVMEVNPVGRGLEQVFVNLQSTISPRILF